MNDFPTTPLKDSLVFCPRCLTENDKSALIVSTILQFAGQKDKKAFVLVRCFGCELEIPLLIRSDGVVEVVNIDPYKDVEEATAPPELSSMTAAPGSDNEADVSYQQGETAFREDNYIEAYRRWRAAYDWYAPRPDERIIRAALLSNMGMALSRLHMSSKALECFEEAIQDMDRLENPSAYATVLNNIGAAYLHLGQMKEAEEYHRRAYELEQDGDPALVARNRQNLAFTYGKIASREARAGNLDLAIGQARKAVALYEDIETSEGRIYFAMLGSLLRNKAESATSRVPPEVALELYREASEVHAQGGVDPNVLFTDYDRLARLQRRLGLLDESLPTMQRADELLEEVGQRKRPLVRWKKPNPIIDLMRRLWKGVRSRS